MRVSDCSGRPGFQRLWMDHALMIADPIGHESHAGDGESHQNEQLFCRSIIFGHKRFLVASHASSSQRDWSAG